MNITKDLIARVERRLTETKTPCKTFKTEANAERVAEALVKAGAEYFGLTEREIRYVIFQIPSTGRYSIGWDMSYILSRGCGGYLGFFGDFYTY